jgi:hypothetical protein
MTRIITCLVITFFFACGSQRNREDLIIGKWEYYKMESYEKKTVELADSMTNIVDSITKGLQYVFTANDSMKIIKKINNNENILFEGTFRLSEDKEFIILTAEDKEDRELRIEDVTTEFLKVHPPLPSLKYLVFKRIE